MPIMRRMKGLPQDLLVAEGLMYQDWTAITPCQRECTTRLCNAIQREQEAYMTSHPEISAMLKMFIARMTQRGKRNDFEKAAAEYFTRSYTDLEEEIKTFLGPQLQDDMASKATYNLDDETLVRDLKRTISKYYPPPPWIVPSPTLSPLNTESSSFISVQTSDTTLPTPEPIPTPEPTISEIFYTLISNTVDKVIFVQIDEGAIIYDTAYVELMKAVEHAMEIPVIDIRHDIAALFDCAYRMFELNVAEKERVAAQVAWERRMRKKLKRSLRRQKNFRGYETPPQTPSSVFSSHESYQGPPPRPCKCQPLANYNRYGKDRFGIYLPSPKGFNKTNITTTPPISSENLLDGDDKTESKSPVSKKSSRTTTHSAVSSKSTTSRRTRPLPADEAGTLTSASAPASAGEAQSQLPTGGKRVRAITPENE